MATTARDVGLGERADAPMRAALETRRRELGAEHRDTLLSMNGLAVLVSMRGMHAEA